MENDPSIQIYQPGRLTEDIFINDVPPLYHYTNRGGFEGMLNSKALWFSNIHDQNDTEEFTYAVNLIHQVIAEEYPGLSLGGPIGGALTGDRKTPIYTCSMSSAKDVLSQWRGYCPDGGFAYSIQKQQLFYMISTQRLILAKCIYKEEDKKALIRELTGMTPKDFWYHNVYRKEQYPHDLSRHSILSDGYKHGIYMAYIRRRLSQHAAIMKQEAFEEEKEWRLITYYDREPNSGQILYGGPHISSLDYIFPWSIPHKTRQSGERAVDYVVLPLAYNKTKTPEGTSIPYPHNPLSQRWYYPDSIPEGEVLLSEVIISPTQDKEAAKLEWQQRLQGHGDVPVQNSRIPYRK
jgi:hypothetical protein